MISILVIYFVTEEQDSKISDKEASNTLQKQRHERPFESGMALLLYRGMIRYGDVPIASGQRHNLVIWLYGKDGSVRFALYDPHEQRSRGQRWLEGRLSPCGGTHVMLLVFSWICFRFATIIL